MPQILVLTDSPHDSGQVVYRERVACSNLESDHFAGQLLERVGWAVGDADQLENGDEEPADAQEHRDQEPADAPEDPVAPPTFAGR